MRSNLKSKCEREDYIMEHLNNDIKLVNSESLVGKYQSSDLVRAIVQSIPTIGPILDVFLAMPGTKLREERLEFYIRTLFDAIQKLEGKIDHHISESEEFQDCVWKSIDSSINSRSKGKIIMNIMIITNFISCDFSNESINPEEYIMILSDLSPIESRIIALFNKIYREDPGVEEVENDLQRANRLQGQEEILSKINVSKEDLYFHLKKIRKNSTN